MTETQKIVDSICNCRRGSMDDKQFRATVEFAIQEVVVEELAQARAEGAREERERIADEFGDFRLMAKGWLGIIKYGRTLRYFLLPHTRHKKGDDETN